MSFLPRSFVVFALCIPLAILLGVMLAEPLGGGTMVLVGSCFLLLLSPFLLKHYHTALVISWNAFLTVFFLPGRPYLWMLMTVIGAGLMILIRTLNRDSFKFLWVPSVGLPLIALGVIAYVTSQFTGGVGLHSLGSEVFGGKKYFYIWFAIIAFFVLTSKALPEDQVKAIGGWFFLASVTACVSNLAYILGPQFYWLFFLFPPEWGIAQAALDQMIGGFTRVTGLAPTSTAVFCYLFYKHGIRGVCDLTKPWRGIMFLVALFLGFYSGFRYVLVILGLLVFFQFFTERLYKTKYVAMLLCGALLSFGVLLPFAHRLPLAMQRVLTVLPLDLDPKVEQDALGSLNWRFEIWRLVAAEIPQYFWLGKGFVINPTDLFLAEESVKRGVYSPYEPTIVAGDYHSGPLSLIIPFGIWGALAFLWFLFGGHRVLWRNYKYSPPEMLIQNQFLLAYFYTRVVFYFVFFGAFYLDVALFVGIVGLSITANGGVRAPVTEPVLVSEPESSSEETEPTGPLVPVFTR